MWNLFIKKSNCIIPANFCTRVLQEDKLLPLCQHKEILHFTTFWEHEQVDLLWKEWE